MFRPILVSLACAAAVSIIAGCANPGTESGAYLGRRHDSYSSDVVAESKFSSASVSGPVRRNSRGLLEVRLPGGTWFGCGRSCSETLRMETVDFWQSHGANRTLSGSDSPGYLVWSR